MNRRTDETWINEGNTVSKVWHDGDNPDEQDYHEDMDSKVFETTPISKVFAPYHSREKKKLSTSAWRKAEIIDWLKSKNIDFDEPMLKPE